MKPEAMKHPRLLPAVPGLLLLAALPGCFTAKTYERPQLETQHLFRTDPLADSLRLRTDSSSLATTSWKELFTDPLLAGYIQQALNNNTDIRIALQRIDAAAAYVKQGKAAFAPTVSAGAGYSLSQNSRNTALGQFITGAVDNYELDAGLSWEADIWGRIRSQQRAYGAAYLGTLEAHKAVQTRLVAAIASSYFQLMALSEQMQVAREGIASRSSSLSTTQALMQAGQVTSVAVNQMEAQVADARITLLHLQDQEHLLENALCLLLNEPPHAIPRGTLAAQQIPAPLSTGVPSELLVNRPDVRQAELALVQAFELTNVARARFYPALTITAAGGLQSTAMDNWFSANSLFYNIAGNLLQPVLNQRQVRTAYEVAQAQQEQALLTYRMALLTAGSDVSNALYDYQVQTASLGLAEQQTKALQAAADQSEQLLANGLANYLEVLTAQQGVLTAQLGLASTKGARLQAIVSLYEALGGGWR
ncbi:MAG: efflux transporter outer membrane subunit [Bacteroidetes bacterium]|nr:efflux transporter outer membrane subunit [Bacteroidota bacterium]